MVCTPGAEQPCYSGPPGTEGEGVCSAGTQTCSEDGSGYGPCEGEVLPATETCNAPDDEDCDGDTNEEGDGCVCAPNGSASCYTGPPATAGVGLCVAGNAACNAEGTALGPCVGEVLPAAESCAATTDPNCDGIVAPSCTGNHVWSKKFGDEQLETIRNVATDAAGNVILAGRFDGNLNFGGPNLGSYGSFDVFVAKLDADGDHIWSKRFGDSDQQLTQGFAVDPAGNVVVGGVFLGTVDFGGGLISTTFGGGDAFVFKLDSAGNHVWSKRFIDGSSSISDQTVHSVATDTSGNVIVVGSFLGTVDVGGGPFVSAGEEDGFVVKLDPAGNHLWSKHIAGSFEQQADSVATDASGNVYVGGRLYAVSVDFGGGPINGGTFVVKYDAAGNHLWSKPYSTEIKAMAVDSSENVILTGEFPGTVDFGGGPLVSGGGEDIYIAKLDAAGNHVWSERYGGIGDQISSGAAIGTDDNIVILGDFENSVDFGGGTLVSAGTVDIFVAKLDAAGNHLWSKRFGDGAGQRGIAVARDVTDNLLITGSLLGNTDFGGGNLYTPTNDIDLYVVKLAP